MVLTTYEEASAGISKIIWVAITAVRNVYLRAVLPFQTDSQVLVTVLHSLLRCSAETWLLQRAVQLYFSRASEEAQVASPLDRKPTIPPEEKRRTEGCCDRASADEQVRS